MLVRHDGVEMFHPLARGIGRFVLSNLCVINIFGTYGWSIPERIIGLRGKPYRFEDSVGVSGRTR